MPEITVELIKTLRDKTNAGMMNCKNALKEANGNLEEAEVLLRKKGIASANKKSSRLAKEGMISSKLFNDSKTGVIIQVNCETDFVAKNENFVDFVEKILNHIENNLELDNLDDLLSSSFYDKSQKCDTLEEFIKAKAGELGENIKLSKFEKYSLNSEGSVGTYIHMKGRVGVLLEMACKNTDTINKEDFISLVKDLTMHIAAASPSYLKRDEVSQGVLDTEKEIMYEQIKDKPENIQSKIIESKLEKFYSLNCLLEQEFIKNEGKDKKTIEALVSEVGKSIGDSNISISKFTRYALGEEN